MENEFSHGSYHEAFVGLALVLESLDVGSDDGVVLGGALDGVLPIYSAEMNNPLDSSGLAAVGN